MKLGCVYLVEHSMFLKIMDSCHHKTFHHKHVYYTIVVKVGLTS